MDKLSDIESKIKDTVTENNIPVFAKKVADDLITKSNEDVSFKKALFEFTSGCTDGNPAKITLYQQKVFAEINTSFIKDIGTYLLEYAGCLPSATEYKIILNVLRENSLCLQKFSKKYVYESPTDVLQAISVIVAGINATDKNNNNREALMKKQESKYIAHDLLEQLIGEAFEAFQRKESHILVDNTESNLSGDTTAEAA